MSGYPAAPSRPRTGRLVLVIVGLCVALAAAVAAASYATPGRNVLTEAAGPSPSISPSSLEPAVAPPPFRAPTLSLPDHIGQWKSGDSPYFVLVAQMYADNAVAKAYFDSADPVLGMTVMFGGTSSAFVDTPDGYVESVLRITVGTIATGATNPTQPVVTVDAGSVGGRAACADWTEGNLASKQRPAHLCMWMGKGAMVGVWTGAMSQSDVASLLLRHVPTVVTEASA